MKPLHQEAYYNFDKIEIQNFARGESIDIFTWLLQPLLASIWTYSSLLKSNFGGRTFGDDLEIFGRDTANRRYNRS